MVQAINSGGIKTLDITHEGSSKRLHTVFTYIHHELTPEREAALAALIEHAIVDVVTGFAS